VIGNDNGKNKIKEPLLEMGAAFFFEHVNFV